MLTLARLAADRFAQHLVGIARAEAADDVDGLFGAQLRMHFPDQVDGFGIHVGRLIFAPVAHDPIDLLHRLGNELAVFLIGDRQGLFGVDVHQGNGAIGARAGSRHAIGRQADTGHHRQ